MYLHVFGASGSGTTSLARALAESLDLMHLDVDDFYWVQSDPPFRHKVPIPTRISRLATAMAEAKAQGRGWIVSGSMVSWGDWLLPLLDAAIFVSLENSERMARLARRERTRYGARIEPGGDMFEQHQAFISWAGTYESASLAQRSRRSHNTWLARLPCPLLRVDNLESLQNQVDRLIPLLAFHRQRREQSLLSWGVGESERSLIGPGIQPGIRLAIRPGVPADAQGISDLIVGLSGAFSAVPGQRPESFLMEATPAELVKQLSGGMCFFGVVEERDRVEAVVSWRRPNHLLYLFIADHRQGHGWGRSLWEWLRRDRALFPEHAPTSWTVNASRNAIGFYRRLGFVAAGELIETNGIAFMPMVIGHSAPK